MALSSISNKHSLNAVVILTIAAIIALASVWRDAPIVDEVPHIGAGYSYIADQTYQFNPEHPPLVKDLAGLALIPLDIPHEFLVNYNQNHPNVVNDQWNFGRALIYHSGVTPTDIVHAAKLPMFLFFILSGWLIFAWTKKYYNSRAATLAVFLFALSPTVVAHSRFVTTDVAALFGILLATFYFVKFLELPDRKNFWCAGVAFGVALLTKFSTFLLVPYLLILALVWIWANRLSVKILLQSILLMIVGFVIIVGPVYLFHTQGYSPQQQKSDTIANLRGHQMKLVADTVIWASDKPILRAYAQYGLGLAMVFKRSVDGNRVYFLGNLSNDSFKAYFPIVFVLKEPIPLLALILFSVWLGIKAWVRTPQGLRRKIRERFPQMTMLLWIVLYTYTSISGNLNIGIRHLMPMYGFIFILVAGQIEQALNIRKWFKVLVFGIFAWYAVEFISVYPSYLTYFNQFAGGPPGGHQYVVDSNLDWGQDLWRLGDYVRENNIQKIYLDYFGWAEQAYYLGESFIWMRGGDYTSLQEFLADNPGGGWLALSATFYQESMLTAEKPYAWLTEHQPKAVVGNSIFVWHLKP